MELSKELGLKEISSIIKTLECTTDIEYMSEDSLECDGVVYGYEKNGNQFLIFDSLGHSIKINLDYREEVKTHPYTQKDVLYAYYDIKADYNLKEGDKFRLAKSIEIYPNEDTFSDLQRNDFLSDIKTSYCDSNEKEVASFNLSLDTICLKDPEAKVEFTSDGIKYDNKVVSMTGDSLLSINGELVPNKDIFDSFNLEEERKKINKIINDNKDLHEFTIEALEETSRKLDGKERYVKKILGFYENDINIIRKAIECRNTIASNIENSIINKNGLELVANHFEMKLKEDDRKRLLDR